MLKSGLHHHPLSFSLFFLPFPILRHSLSNAYEAPNRCVHYQKEDVASVCRAVFIPLIDFEDRIEVAVQEGLQASFITEHHRIFFMLTVHHTHGIWCTCAEPDWGTFQAGKGDLHPFCL